MILFIKGDIHIPHINAAIDFAGRNKFACIDWNLVKDSSKSEHRQNMVPAGQTVLTETLRLRPPVSHAKFLALK